MNYSEEIKNTVFSLNHKYNKPSNLLYIVVLVAAIGAVVSLPFINITIDSQARGVLRSQKENVKLTSVVQGKVSFVNLKNNQSVEKGELLLEIAPLLESVQEETKKTLLIRLQKQFSDLTLLCKNNFNSSKTELYQKEVSHYLQRLKELKDKKQQLFRTYERSKKGFDAGIISKAIFEKDNNELETSKTAIVTFEKQQYSEWQSKKEQIEEQIKILVGEIDQLTEKKKNYSLKAPMSGTIVNYSGVKKDVYFNGSEIVAEISPDDEIILECFVNPKDIGFIKIGQSVKLQMDAFNYNQWGLGKATVYEIDRNLTIKEQQSYFIVRCKLQTNELILKNGYKAQLKKGMTCTARLTLTERSLWNLLFDKVDDWFNPKII